MEMPPMTDRRALMIGSLAALASPALAQARPVRLIVPFPPGGAVDLLGRILAERLGPTLGTGVVVENRGGAGGLIGADAVAKGDKDGTVLGLVSVTILCAFPFMTARMPFNPRTDLAPVSQITDGALLCVVNAGNGPAARLDGFPLPHLLEPGQSGRCEDGQQRRRHLVAHQHRGDQPLRRAGILHVPYRGGGPAINDLLAGNIDIMFDVMPALMPHVESGALLAFAVSPNARLGAAAAGAGHGRIRRPRAWAAQAQHLERGDGARRDARGTRSRASRGAAGRCAHADFVERLKPLGYGTVSANAGRLTALIERETPHWRQLVEISGAGWNRATA
jgi:tripartite-type tricarboxylate transporter receptor subunit TctC